VTDRISVWHDPASTLRWYALLSVVGLVVTVFLGLPTWVSMLFLGYSVIAFLVAAVVGRGSKQPSRRTA
jgi:hypothetical protein